MSNILPLILVKWLPLLYGENLLNIKESLFVQSLIKWLLVTQRVIGKYLKETRQ